MEMIQIALQKKTIREYKKDKTISISQEISKPITISQTQICTENLQVYFICRIKLLSSHWLKKWAGISIFVAFLQLHSTLKQYDSLKFQRRCPLDSWFWSRFCNSNRGRYSTRNDNKLRREISTSLEPAVVRETSFWTINCLESQSLPASKGHMKWRMTYFQV